MALILPIYINGLTKNGDVNEGFLNSQNQSLYHWLRRRIGRERALGVANKVEKIILNIDIFFLISLRGFKEQFCFGTEAGFCQIERSNRKKEQWRLAPRIDIRLYPADGFQPQPI